MLFSFFFFARKQSFLDSQWLFLCAVGSTVVVSLLHGILTTICFADDIDGSAEEEEELANLVELMTNNTSGINSEIRVNGQKLEAVTSFKYLGSVITDKDSGIAQTTAALTRLTPVWIDKSVSLSSKIRLMRSLSLIHI